MNEAESARPARPILGALSILLPAFGGGLWLFFIKNPHLGNGLNGYAGLFIFFGLLGISAVLVLGSITCAIVGLVRRERWRFVHIIGLLLNAAIILIFKR